MAHELDMSNGRANMAYVGSKPWHGLGHILKPGASIAEWTSAAGLSWDANIHTLGYHDVATDTWIKVPDMVVLTRSDTKAFLAAHTTQYVPAQPIDIMNFFRDFVLTDDRFQMETAGSLKHGKVIWALARFKEDQTVLGERHAAYVFLSTSFDGTLATSAQATMIRVVCNNTLTAAIFDPKAAAVRLRHTQRFEGVVASEAHRQLAEVASGFKQYEVMAEALHKIRIARDTTKKLFESLLTEPVLDPVTKKLTPRGETMRAKTMGKFFDMLDKTVKNGADAGTGWATFNAVTDYVDHEKRTRGGTDQDANRMASSFFGTGLQMKSKALQNLLALADTKPDLVLAA